MGGAAGLAAVLGLGLLPYRRLRVVAIRRASGRSDRLTCPCPRPRWRSCCSPA
ncbi:hypothetical protein ACWDBD_27205 [Streptomyces sp. NPDC001118]